MEYFARDITDKIRYPFKYFDLFDGIKAYNHYRSGKGTDLTINYDKAYYQDENIRKAVDAQIAEVQKAAEELYKLSGQNSFKITGQLVTIGGDFYTYPVTENWQKTLGSHAIWISADVSVDENGQFNMVTTVHAIDRYNFNRGDYDIASGTPDEINGRFAELGWAKPFNTVGQIEREVTWAGEDIPDTTTIINPNLNNPIYLFRRLFWVPADNFRSIRDRD